ncbi:unnamed protein product [Coffea canephora]|uniref:DH200=94 genomic scaffold, scaffold_801 n=1 Tax=Coffea canephora TaxID=49390 RepID=A0A068VJU7_COFCA|nr:unnamed protein product [Coffea canephora]
MIFLHHPFFLYIVDLIGSSNFIYMNYLNGKACLHLEGVKCSNQLSVLLPNCSTFCLHYFRSLSGLNAEGFEILDANMSAKGMRISVSTEEELGSSMERKDAADDFGEPGNSLMAVWLLYLLVLSQRLHN